MRSRRSHTARAIGRRASRLSFCSSLLLLLGGGFIAAQVNGGTEKKGSEDSTKVYPLPGVTVEAESILSGIARGTQPTAVVTRAQIEASGAIDLSDAVAYAPGVFVKRYGGLGGLRTISLRGTSAQQSIILIDGVRYRASASGAFDLSNIPADAIERVEVIRGGNGALYGANALGGVINIITHGGGERPVTANLRGGIGSFGERTLGVAATGGGAGHAWDGSLHSTTAAGDYPFSFNEFGETTTMRRENADFSGLYGRAGWSYRDDGGVRLSLDAQGFRSERGVPGAVVQGSREQLRARLNESDLFAVARVSYGKDLWNVSATASARGNMLRYRDPDARVAGPEGIDNRYDAADAAGSLRGRLAIGETGVLEASADLAYSSLRGDNLDPAAASFVKRSQWSGALTSSWFFESGLLGWESSIDAGVRGDLFSDLDPALSPSLGAAWRLGGTPLRLRARASSSYRAPSFAEQYYLNYGNRDLRPERALSIDGGVTCEIEESIVLEGTFFSIATRDQILSIPRSPVSWSAANVARVLSRGAELAAAGSLFDGVIDLNISYTLMRTEDRSEGESHGKLLPYTPQELFNGVIGLHIGEIGIGASWSYASHRYTLPLNEYASSLPHYLVLGMNIGSRWKLGPLDIDGRIECSNLLDAEYQVVRNYPMPGRAFRLEIGVKYGGAR